MPKGQSTKVVFKKSYREEYANQPLNFEELIGEQDIVRQIDKLVDEIDISAIESTYKGGGASRYHPAMLLKVLIYAYIRKIYSGRMIEKVMKENIKFMWLSGMNMPDFRTLNSFLSGRLVGLMEDILSQVSELLLKNGLITLKTLSIDGTKVEANANKYSYVWAKNTERYKTAVEKKVKALMNEIVRINKEEDEKYGDEGLEEIRMKEDVTIQEIKQVADNISEKIREKMSQRQALTKGQKKLKKLSDEIKKKLMPRLEKYETQERILNGRGSYSKTDKDATFHRMKDERLLPSYNIIITTEDQYILNYTVHQNPGERQYLIDHMQKFEQRNGKLPESLVGDAAFGTEENYQYLEEKAIGNYLKYGNFYRESKGLHGKYYEKEDFDYNPVGDYYICPYLRKLKYKKTVKEKGRYGYEIVTRQYECEGCQGCPLSQMCRKGKSNRRLDINKNLERLQKQASTNLKSEEGIRLRKKRSVDVESVFGDIKQNFGIRRFRLRGISKVTAEFGLVSLAHNVKKMHIALSEADKKPISTQNDSQNIDFYLFLKFLVVLSSIKYIRCVIYKIKKVRLTLIFF